MQGRNRAALTALVLVLTLAWRVAISVAVAPEWEKKRGMAVAPDSYTHLARTLIDQKVLGYGRYGATPTSVRGPGFPLWLAAGMLVGGDDLGWLRLWASLPGALGAALITWLLAGRYGSAAAGVGGLLAGCHPIPVLGSARLLGDEFYGVLGLVAAALLAKAVSDREERGSPAYALLFGGFLFLIAHLLTRSSALLTWVALLFVFVLVRPGFWERFGSSRKSNEGVSASRRPIVIILIIALVPAGIWSWRTSRLEGRPVYMHSLTAFNFWIGEAHHRYGFANTWEETRRRELRLVFEHGGLDDEKILSFSHAALEPKAVAHLEKRLQSEAIDHVLHHPLNYAYRGLHGIYRFWVAAQTKPWPPAYVLPIVVFVLLVMLGSVRILRERAAVDRLAVALLLAVVLHNLAYAAVLPTAKMSAQIYPSAAYLAGIGAAVIARLSVRRLEGSSS